MTTLVFTSPRTRGLAYLLGTIASTTVFGHLSEFCSLTDFDCTAHQHTVISFGVLSTFFGILLFLGALMAIPKLRFMEFSIACLFVPCTLVMAIIASLEKTREDMLKGAEELKGFGRLTALDDASGPIFWDIIVGFSWFALFLAVLGLYHLVLYGLKAEKTKELDEAA